MIPADGVTVTRAIGTDPERFAYFSVKVDLAEYARSLLARFKPPVHSADPPGLVTPGAAGLESQPGGLTSESAS